MTQGDDLDLWTRYARQVKKLNDKAPKEESPQTGEALCTPAQTHNENFQPKEMTERQTGKSCFEAEEIKQSALTGPWKKEPLDPHIERNLSLGDVVIEARLDLHGHTEQEAYERFRAFVTAQASRGRRLLLVITGHGGTEGSVLRQNLPRWCGVPPFEVWVLAVRTAAPHHGGDGAYYVLLRKQEKRRTP